MKCNLCGCENFLDTPAKAKVRCECCNSYERTRLLWMYISRHKINESFNVLHIAPEQGLYTKLSSLLLKESYDVVDYNPATYPFADECGKINLCDLDNKESNYYDLIIHSHVLEHTYCNISYTLYHLHRMLKKDGRHICVIPFMGGYYDESFANLANEERKARFGQEDHVRRFGASDIPKHLGAILNIGEKFDATDTFTESELLANNIERASWKGFHVNTVLDLGKHDYLL